MEIYLQQGNLTSIPAYKIQKTFGINETLVFALEGLGASIFSLSLMISNVMGLYSGLLLTFMGVLLLLFHLGHPEKAWRALKGIKTSWISRGTALLGIFLTTGALYCILQHIGVLSAHSPFNLAFKLFFIVLAFLILVYPGLVLSYSPSIPFWKNSFLPTLFVLSSITSGLSWIIVSLSVQSVQNVQSIQSSAPLLTYLLWIQPTLLIVLIGTIFLYVRKMDASKGAAHESARQLLSQATFFSFSVMGCGVGTLVPLTFYAISSTHVSMLFVSSLIAALAKTIGDVFLRYSLVKVGMYDPIY